jgi:HEAT repeat protein
MIRVSSCFGLAAIGDEAGDRVDRLGEVLASDSDARVRGAAAASLGIAGGDDAPPALLGATADADANVRRSAVQALGSFDDPNTGQTLGECVEDEDRETALRAAEALLALARRPRAASEVRARLESSYAWAIEYARKVEEVNEVAA